MKFGLVPRCHLSFDETLAMVRRAEEVGFESVWVPEHHGQPGHYSSPLVASAGLLASTERIRVGTFVLLLPLQHPVHVAEAVLMLDLISHGRFTLGVAIGYIEEEFQTFGVARRERAGRLEESVEIMKRLWTDGEVSHHGKYYKIPRAAIFQRPVQRPHPPVWIGGYFEDAVRRAARIGDAWLPGLAGNLALLKKGSEIYRETLTELGKLDRQRDFPLGREVFVAETREKAHADGGAPIVKFYQECYWKWEHPAVRVARSSSYEDLIRDRFVVGTPDEVIRQLETYERELGVTHLLCSMRAPGIGERALANSLELFIKEVKPHFEKR